MIKELSLPTRESPVSGKATVREIAQDYYASQGEAVVNIDINANRALVADFTVEQISGAAACGGFFIMENSIFKRLASFFMGGGQDKQKETKFVGKGKNYGNEKSGFTDDTVQVRHEDGISAGIHKCGTSKVQTRSDIRSIRSLAQGLALEQRGDREVSEKRRQFAEADRLVEAAKQNGLFIPKSQLQGYGTRVNVISGESVVFFDQEKRMYYKAKDPYARSVAKNSHAEDAVFEHIIHNILFPDTRYEFIGVNGGNEDVRFVLAQREVHSCQKPTQKQIGDYMENVLGLRKEDEYSWGNSYLSVTDVEAGSDNAFIGFDGKIYFIDPLIRLKQPAIKVIERLTGIDVERELQFGKDKPAELPQKQDKGMKI